MPPAGSHLHLWRGAGGEGLWFDFRYTFFMKLVYLVVVLLFLAIAVYHLHKKTTNSIVASSDSLNNISTIKSDTIRSVPSPTPAVPDSIFSTQISTANTSTDSLIAFAETLIGTPYKYASTDPSQGFDC